jgi:LysR family transcriptional regulator for metE and metH
MDLEVRHLRLVVAVADVGSLTRAGDRLNLTQSALSHQLRDIESRLGTPLFLRVGKRLVLTPAGERLLESAREVLGRLQSAERDVRQMGKDRARVLRLTTECYTCYHWLPPILTDYRKQFPGVEVRIDVDATSHPIQALLDHKIDVAVTISEHSSLDRRLVRRTVLDDELVVIMASAHRLAGRRAIWPADLQDETLFIYPPKHESGVLQRILTPAGVEEIKLTEAITELVKAGLGVAALARWAVQPYLDAGGLVGLPFAVHAGQRRWRAVMLKEVARADYVQAFIDLLVRRAPAATGSSVNPGLSPSASKRRSTTRSTTRRRA